MGYHYSEEEVKKAMQEWINPIPEDDRDLIIEEDYIIHGEKVTVLDYADPYLDADTQYYKAGLWYDSSWDGIGKQLLQKSKAIRGRERK